MIPTWNGREILARNLPSIETALRAYPGGGEILVVDDGSDDRTVEWISSAHPDVRLFAQVSNQGFGAAVNAGVRAAHHGHVVLLNNDMRAEQDFLAALIEPFETEARLFATTPRIVNRTFGGDEAVTACTFRRGLLETLFPDRDVSLPVTALETNRVAAERSETAPSEVDPSPAGRTETFPAEGHVPDPSPHGAVGAIAGSPPARAEQTASVGGSGGPTEGREPHGRARANDDLDPMRRRSSLPGVRSSYQEVLFACGGAAAIDRSMFEAIGGLDPLFAPFYWEDVDLSWRARKRGWRILHVPASCVHHEHSATIGARFDRDRVGAIYERNRLLFHWKNLSSGRLLARHALWIVPRIVRAIFGRPAFLRGFVMALGRMPAVLRGSRLERSARRVSDEAIVDAFRLDAPALGARAARRHSDPRQRASVTKSADTSRSRS